MFDVKGELTIDNILEKITEYDIFKAYCPNFIDIDKKFVATLNRNKTEDYPSANITYYKGKLWYKDFGNSDKAMDCFSYIQAKYKASFVQALGIINLDFNLGLKNESTLRPSLNYIGLPDTMFVRREKESTIIRPKFRQWLQRDYQYWLVDFSIQKPTLEHYNVKPLQWYLLNDRFIQGEKLTYSYFVDEEDKVKYYKVYSPHSLTSKWITNCKAHHYQGYNQLPMSGDLLIITKSLKDVMLLYQLGYNSIAPNSESSRIEDDFMGLMHRRFEKVVIFFDNDDAGIRGAGKITYHHGVDNITIPYEYKGKDISDVVKYNGVDKGKEIMKKLLNGIHI